MRRRNFKILIVVLVALLTGTQCFSANRYFIGTVASSWNASSSWSATSGGPGGAAIPGTFDNVIFDGAGGANGNCLIPASVSVASITVAAGYSGSILQGPVATITTSAAFTFSAPASSFVGSAQAITLGSFAQTAGTFTTTSGTMKINGNTDFTGGTFNHNLGTINFNILSGGSALNVTGSPTINNLIFTSADFVQIMTISNNLIANNITLNMTGSGAVRVQITGTLRAKGNLTFAGSLAQHYLTGGTLYAEKDVFLNSAVVNVTSSTNAATIELCGIVDQTITSTVPIGDNCLPSVVVNKPSGILHLVGTITVSGPNWNYITAASIDPGAAGTSRIIFYQPSGGANIAVAGDQTLGDVLILLTTAVNGLTVLNNLGVDNLTLNAATGVKLVLAGTVTVNKTLTLTGAGSNIVLTGGIIYAKGDIVLSVTSPTLDVLNTSTINICGTGAQTVTGTTSLGQCVLPSIVIDKPAGSGTLTLTNNIALMGDWTYLQGTVDPGSSSVYVFCNSTSVFPTIDAQGATSSMSFYNLRVNNAASSPVKVGGNLDINNDFRIVTNTKLDNTAGNYDINIGGNFTNAGRFFPGNGTVTFDGPLPQTYQHTNYAPPLEPASVINTLVINKSFGGLTLSSPLEVKASGSMVLTKGIITVPSTSLLTLNDAATTTIGSAISYVEGTLNYMVGVNGTRTINLPIGLGGAWRPVELTVQHNTTTVFKYTAQVVNASAIAFHYTLPPTLTHVSGKRYWEIDSNVPTTNFIRGKVNLYFDTDDEVANITRLGIARTALPSPTAWSDISGGTKSGTGGPPYLTGSVASVLYVPAGAPTPFSNIFSLANLVAGAGVINPLPIELSFFSVTNQQESALLNWETKSELNNDYFEIQRSVDGTEFEVIGEVKGAGTKSGNSYYSHLDKKPYAGVSYYRLRQVDFNNAATFSDVVRFSSNASDASLVIYPVPAVNANINFNRTSTVRLVNFAGAVLSTFTNVDSIDVSNLPAGLYFVIDEMGRSYRVPVIH